jgi:O-antigen/teichoic acid export membrane protein
LFIAWLANRKYPYLKDKEVAPLSSTEKKELFTNIKALSIAKVAGVTCSGTDNIIITKLLGLASVGLVSNYTLIINTMSGMLYSMLTGMTGSVGNLNAEEDLHKRKQVFNQLMMLSYLIYSSICACLIVLINHFVSEVWLGAQYVIDMTTIVALVLIAFQSGMNFTAYTFRATIGCFKEVKYVYVATAILHIILSIILGLWLGLAGVFLATTISKLLTSELADGYYSYKRALKTNPVKYFIKLLAYYSLFAINALVCYWVIKFIEIGGVWGFLVKGGACFVLSNIVNILVLCPTGAFKGLLKKGKLLIKRKTRRS